MSEIGGRRVIARETKDEKATVAFEDEGATAQGMQAAGQLSPIAYPSCNMLGTTCRQTNQ